VERGVGRGEIRVNLGRLLKIAPGAGGSYGVEATLPHPRKPLRRRWMMGAMLFGLRILFILGAVLAIAMELVVFGGGLFFVAQAQQVLDAPPYRVDRDRVALTTARLPLLAHRDGVAQLPGRNGDGARRVLPAPSRVTVREGEEADRLLAA